MLSCIAEAGGEARLPDSVTVSGFRQWVAAVADDDEIFESRAFASRCTVRSHLLLLLSAPADACLDIIDRCC